MKSNMKIVQSGDKIVWTDRKTGSEIFTADCSKIPNYEKVKLAGQLCVNIFQYGIKQITADGAASVSSTTGKRDKMAARFGQVVSGTYGTRAASVAKMEHEVLFVALVQLGHAVDNENYRAKFAKLPATAIAQIYARPDVVAKLAEMESGEIAAEFTDLLPESDDEVSEDETESEDSTETE